MKHKAKNHRDVPTLFYIETLPWTRLDAHTECAISKNTSCTQTVRHDSAWRGSITKADWCPFAGLFIFIYLSVYLCQLYLLMGLKDAVGWQISICAYRATKKEKDESHLQGNEQKTRRRTKFTVLVRFQELKWRSISDNGTALCLFTVVANGWASSLFFAFWFSNWLVWNGQIWVYFTPLHFSEL